MIKGQEEKVTTIPINLIVPQPKNLSNDCATANISYFWVRQTIVLDVSMQSNYVTLSAK